MSDLRGRRGAAGGHALFALALGTVLVLALAMRLPDLERFLTPDETRWTCRSANFWNGLATGDLAATYQKEHPGVVTMWLGGLGQRVDPEADWAIACREIPMSKLVAEAPRSALDGIRDRLFAGRRRVAVFVSLCIGLAMLLAARIFDRRTALLTGLLLALDPFFIPLGRVLHVDALMSSLMLLSALTLLLALQGRRRSALGSDAATAGSEMAGGRASASPAIGWLLLSGGLAGLAALAKSPAIFLIPWAGLVLGLDAWGRRTAGGLHASGQDDGSGLTSASGPALLRVAMRSLPAAVGLTLWRLLPWVLAAAAAYVAAWPSMWIAPLETLQQVFGGAADYAANPHEGHNYFRGRPIDDPGPSFYAVAWWWRTTPWTLVGLLLAAVGAGALLRTWGRRRRAAAARRTEHDLPALLGLLLFALFFGIFMSMGAKKFDRYLLPAIPPLLVVAAWGWGRGAAWLGAWLGTWRGAVPVVPGGLEVAGRRRVVEAGASVLIMAVLLLGLLMTDLSHRPYYLTWFNPLAGGQSAAPETLLVGWGEGTGEPAFWLNERPDAAQLEVATRYRSAFGPIFKGHALEMNKIDPATVDYYLFYINQLQRDLDPELIDAFGLAVEGAAAGTPRWWQSIEARIEQGAQAPVHMTRIDDLVYSLLYENRNWAPAVEAIERRDDPATDVIVTRADSGFAAHYDGPLEVIGIDADADRETILAVLEQVFTEHERVWWVRYDDLIPRPGLEHADHALAVRTFETWSVELPELRVARFERPPGEGFVDFTTPVSAPWREVEADFGDRLALSGVRLSSEPIEWGRGLDITLRWRALDDLEANYTAFLHLIGPDGRRWAQRDRRIGDERLVPTERWVEGDGAEDTYFLTIPPATPPGEYTLLVGVYDGATGERLAPEMLGEAATAVSDAAAPVRIEGDTLGVPVAVGRSPFTPEGTLLSLTESAGAGFEIVPGIVWRGYTLAAPAIAGETVSLGVVYQAKALQDAATVLESDVRVRVTLRDREEREVGQGTFELVPGLPPDRWAPGDLLRAWYDLPLDGRALAGDGSVELALIDGRGREVTVGGDGDSRVASDEIDFPIAGPARQFEPPSIVDRTLPRVGAQVGDVATLLAAALAPEGTDPERVQSAPYHVAPGDRLSAILLWRAERDPQTDYQAFLHLVAPDGTIVDQRDQAPGGGARPMTSWLAGEHILGETVLEIPADGPAGDYALVVGLYDPADGARLPIDVGRDAEGVAPSGGARERWREGYLLSDHRLRAATVRVR